MVCLVLADSIGSANCARRGLGSETSLRWHRGPARLWIAIAVLVAGTIWLWSSSSVGLLGTYRVQVRSALASPTPVSVVILLCCLFCLAFEGRPIAMPIYAMRVKVNGERLWLCMYVMVLTKAFCKANH